MTTSAHRALSTDHTHRARTAALLTGAAAVIGAGVFLQRHREELTALGEQHGVPADPQT